MSDYNHLTFIAEFENMLEGLGFYLKKPFDDVKGGRFFERGGRKNKAIGRYKYVPNYETQSGNHLIMYTFFEIRDKATQKLVSSSKTEYFWHKTNNQFNRQKPKFDKAEYDRKRAEAEKKEAELLKQLSEQAYKEYLDLIDNTLDANQHPYSKRKNIQVTRGVIVARKSLKIPSHYNQFRTDIKTHEFHYVSRGDLIIPAIDIYFNFRTYQAIDRNGGKRQRIDITTVGAFHLIGQWDKNTKRVFLVEGYATGFTLHRAMKNAVVLVCFDVNNIGVVADLLAYHYKDLEFIIATDNDRKKSTKVGLYKGFEYSYKHNKPFIFPKFEDEPEYEDLSDFNDLGTVMLDHEIYEMVENQINFFKEYGKEKCITWVAQANGLSLDNLREYASVSKVQGLFSSLNL